jgi:hypothetical protein
VLGHTGGSVVAYLEPNHNSDVSFGCEPDVIVLVLPSMRPARLLGWPTEIMYAAVR